ncbi:MAG: TRAM domain-containing protein [Planctomycetes bacterium]|jgi:uncharacterized protein YacL|nr:TRAM domain-containing protein [Phycisphaerae bacterium]NBB96114.1 TRAM domain-containing protein [Planctomycetota bacterium]
MIIHLIRAVFIVAVLGLTSSILLNQDFVNEHRENIYAYIIIPAMLGVALVFVDMFWRRKQLNTLSGLFFGLLAGLFMAWIFTALIDMVIAIVPQYDQYSTVIVLIKNLTGAVLVFLCVTIVMQTKDEFRFVIPYVEFSKQAKGARPILLDTSVIIDGRISDMVETGIFDAEMIVPRFVLSELQSIADSGDKLKRNRGRRGLDVLHKLQNDPAADIKILEVHVPNVAAEAAVDAKLVAFAEHLNGRIMTNDYNLNKVAGLRGIDVININDLANALKPVVLPGEKMTVKVIRPGEEPGQGVGYLDDGTMVVTEHGREHIGSQVEITVTSVLQTSAGRMIFGRVDRAEKSRPPREAETSERT